MKDKAEEYFVEYTNLLKSSELFGVSGATVIHMMEQFAMQQLEEYTQYLLKEGYCDTDVYSEEPTAIDRFIHPKLR